MPRRQKMILANVLNSRWCSPADEESDGILTSRRPVFSLSMTPCGYQRYCIGSIWSSVITTSSDCYVVTKMSYSVKCVSLYDLSNDQRRNDAVQRKHCFLGNKIKGLFHEEWNETVQRDDDPPFQMHLKRSQVYFEHLQCTSQPNGVLDWNGCDTLRVLYEALNGKIILISGLHSRRVCLPLINQAFSVDSSPAGSRKSVFLTPSAWAKALEWVPHCPLVEIVWNNPAPFKRCH